MGTLYIVGTPIGNLGDLSGRAAEALKESTFVIAEDTREAKKLLHHLGFQKSVVRFDENVGEKQAKEIVEKIGEESASFITDAGTPNVSDPGWQLVARAHDAQINVVPIPGSSALTAGISVAHFPVHPFVFWGFPPHKKGRETFFKNIADEKRAEILYESPHRIEKTLVSLSKLMPERHVMVAKELTKLYEKILRGTAQDILMQFAQFTEKERKGEYVIVIAPEKYGQK